MLITPVGRTKSEHPSTQAPGKFSLWSVGSRLTLPGGKREKENKGEDLKPLRNAELMSSLGIPAPLAVLPSFQLPALWNRGPGVAGPPIQASPSDWQQGGGCSEKREEWAEDGRRGGSTRLACLGLWPEALPSWGEKKQTNPKPPNEQKSPPPAPDPP